MQLLRIIDLLLLNYSNLASRIENDIVFIENLSSKLSLCPLHFAKDAICSNDLIPYLLQRKSLKDLFLFSYTHSCWWRFKLLIMGIGTAQTNAVRTAIASCYWGINRHQGIITPLSAHVYFLERFLNTEPCLKH